MAKSCLPFLMFQGQAQEAFDLYLAAFPDASGEVVDRYGEGEPVSAGSLRRARITIAGQDILLFDSPPMHDFTFTPSFSLFVECKTEEELHRLADVLGKSGKVLMEPDNYGFSQQFTWLADRFGVSWQLNLA